MERHPSSHFMRLFFIFLTLFIPGCAGPNEPASTDVISAHRTLALVSLSLDGVAVKNLGQRTLTDVTLILNVKRPGEKSAEAVVGAIPPAKTVAVPFAEFTDMDGKRFDASTTRVYTVAIKTPLESNPDGYRLFLCSSNVCQPAGQ